MMDEVYGFIERFGGDAFWTGVINLCFFAGLFWSAFKASADKVGSLVPVVRLGRHARLAKLKRFRSIAQNAKFGATPYVASVLDWRNCVRWLTQFLMNTVWFSLNALLAAGASDPTANHIAMAIIGAVALWNLWQVNSAADKAWQHAHWTAYPQAWRSVLLSERAKKN
jgi:hypothetical protein